MIVGSFMKMKLPIGNPFNWIASGDLGLDNFKHILRYSDYPKWLVNSLIITIIPTFSQMFFAAILGYLFSKKNFLVEM